MIFPRLNYQNRNRPPRHLRLRLCHLLVLDLRQILDAEVDHVLRAVLVVIDHVQGHPVAHHTGIKLGSLKFIKLGECVDVVAHHTGIVV